MYARIAWRWAPQRNRERADLLAPLVVRGRLQAAARGHDRRMPRPPRAAC